MIESDDIEARRQRQGISNASSSQNSNSLKLPQLRRTAKDTQLPTSKKSGDSSHASGSPLRRKTLSDIQEDRLAQANALAKAARLATKTSQHEPILKWKEGTADIAGWKQDTQSSSYPTTAANNHSPAGSLRTTAPVLSSPGPSSPGPSNLGPLNQRSLLFSDQVNSQDDGYGLLTEHGMPPLEDSITQKMLSLPDIVCKAASGDIFIVGLSDVQDMLHKRRLGPKGHAILKRFEAATPGGWDLERDKELDEVNLDSVSSDLRASSAEEKKTRGSKKRQPKTKLPSSDGELGLAAAPAHRTSTQGGGGRQMSLTMANSFKERRQSRQGVANEMDVLDEVLRKHIEHTVSLVEAHRQHLKATSGKYLAEQQKLSDAARVKKQRQNAIEFIVHKFLPEKLLHMARIFKGSKKEADGNEGLLDDEEKEILESAIMATAAAGQSSEEASTLTSSVGNDASSSFTFAMNVNPHPTASRWGRVKVKVDDVYARLPFLKDWSKAIDGDKKENTGWDALLGSTSSEVYVKSGSGAKGQGSSVYILKCQELGVVPSSQVVQQLQETYSNMSYCQLGREGAKALRHALVVNTQIRELSLRNNGLDSQAVSEIISGLSSGTMATASKKLRAKTEAKWVSLDHMRVKKPDLRVDLVPKSLGCSSPSLASRSSSPFDDYESASPTRQASAASGVSTAGKINMQRLPSMLSQIYLLDLSENPFGVNGVKVIADLLNPEIAPFQFLTTVKLNKCRIPEQGGIFLARAIMNANEVLSTLHLSNNSLGNKAALIFGELLRSNFTLTDLDLSWNQIKQEGVAQLCKGLEDNFHLKRFNLSWNGLEEAGVKRIGQLLGVNRGLVHLDLTNTRMGPESALVMAEGLRSNNILEELILNGNAVGDDGARHIMDALKNNNSLKYLGLMGINHSSAAKSHAATVFNPLAPDGTYTLNLTEQVDRVVASQLCALDYSAETDLMKNIKIDGKNISSCKTANWPAALPTRGILRFDFNSKKQRKVMQVMEQKKFQALVGQLSGHVMSDKEKLSLVEVMAPFTYLYCHQIAAIVHTFSPMANEISEAAAILFSRGADLEDNMDQLTSSMQELDLQGLLDLLGWYSYVRFSNPTGHYEFSLSTRVHRMLCQRLKDVACGEAPEVPTQPGLSGNSVGALAPNNNWINIWHDLYTKSEKVHQNFGPPEAWKGAIPTSGVLSFDYVSGSTPPPDAIPIGDDQLMDFLHNGIGIAVDPRSGQLLPEQDHQQADLQIALLRQEVGVHFYVTCAQVSRIVDCFVASPHRVEVVIMFYSVVVDRRNLALCLYALKPMEQAVLLWRLGPTNVFDKSHPYYEIECQSDICNSVAFARIFYRSVADLLLSSPHTAGHYVLDCSNPSHELIAHRLVDLAGTSSDLPNIWNIRLHGGRKQISENKNMWGMLTSETFTPFIEFDFLGPDVHMLLGKTPEEFEVIGKGEKLEMVTRYAKRLEYERLRAMYGYYSDGSGWAEKPAWQSQELLFRAQARKTPWNAAWDRVARLLFRFEQRNGDVQSDSPLEDIFDEHSNEENEMTQDSFELCLKDLGFARAEIYLFFRELFSAVARPSIMAPAESVAGDSSVVNRNLYVLDFQSFVDIVLREPPLMLRWMEVPVEETLSKAKDGKKKGDRKPA